MAQRPKTVPNCQNESSKSNFCLREKSRMDFPRGINGIPLGHFSRRSRVASQPNSESNLGSGTILGRPSLGRCTHLIPCGTSQQVSKLLLCSCTWSVMIRNENSRALKFKGYVKFSLSNDHCFDHENFLTSDTVDLQIAIAECAHLVGHVKHEMMHIMGFYHEHSR